MSKDKTKKVSIFTILIFILCGFLFVYWVLSVFSVTSYIKEMFDYGTITLKGNFFDILSYYMTNCCIYLIYIAILLSIWWTRCRCGESVSSDEAENTAKEEVKVAADDSIKGDTPAIETVATDNIKGDAPAIETVVTDKPAAAIDEKKDTNLNPKDDAAYSFNANEEKKDF